MIVSVYYYRFPTTGKGQGTLPHKTLHRQKAEFSPADQRKAGSWKRPMLETQTHRDFLRLRLDRDNRETPSSPPPSLFSIKSQATAVYAGGKVESKETESPCDTGAHWRPKAESGAPQMVKLKVNIKYNFFFYFSSVLYKQRVKSIRPI